MHSADYIFWSFEISEDILRIQTFIQQYLFARSSARPIAPGADCSCICNQQLFLVSVSIFRTAPRSIKQRFRGDRPGGGYCKQTPIHLLSVLDSFSNQRLTYLAPFWIILVFISTILLKVTMLPIPKGQRRGLISRNRGVTRPLSH